jgi:uncharacterized membrane protein
MQVVVVVRVIEARHYQVVVMVVVVPVAEDGMIQLIHELMAPPEVQTQAGVEVVVGMVLLVALELS